MANKIVSGLLLFLLIAVNAGASDSVLFLETQMVGGYSSLQNQTVYYSMDSNHALQKPSVGIDYFRKISSGSGEWGTLSFQGRVAHDDANDNHIETQIYNAYIQHDFWFGDIWAGHNKPSFGLNAALDSRAALIQTLTAEGLGFGWDWGAGYYTQFSGGDISVSFTSGSGFMMYYQGNYLFSTRFSYGILNKDNYSIGLSFSNGNIFDMVDYHRLSDTLYSATSGGVDFSWNIKKIELKCESIIGSMGCNDINGTLVRVGYNLLKDNRMKLELQPMVSSTIDNGQDYKIYSGITYMLSRFFTIRAMYEYNHFNNDHLTIGQLYYYGLI